MPTSWSGGGGGGRSGDWVRSSKGSGGAKPYFELGIQTVKASHITRTTHIRHTIIMTVKASSPHLHYFPKRRGY